MKTVIGALLIQITMCYRLFVTGFVKTVPICTTIEIHFMA